MPTYDQTQTFKNNYAALDAEKKRQVKVAIKHFYDDLKAGRPFRASLRVKRVTDARGIWEMTWAGDGRCTFEYGVEARAGHTHIIWRKCGTHRILLSP